MTAYHSTSVCGSLSVRGNILTHISFYSTIRKLFCRRTIIDSTKGYAPDAPYNTIGVFDRCKSVIDGKTITVRTNCCF